MNNLAKRFLGAFTAFAVMFGSFGAVPRGVLPSLVVPASAYNEKSLTDFSTKTELAAGDTITDNVGFKVSINGTTYSEVRCCEIGDSNTSEYKVYLYDAEIYGDVIAEIDREGYSTWYAQYDSDSNTLTITKKRGVHSKVVSSLSANYSERKKLNVGDGIYIDGYSFYIKIGDVEYREASIYVYEGYLELATSGSDPIIINDPDTTGSWYAQYDSDECLLTLSRQDDPLGTVKNPWVIESADNLQTHISNDCSLIPGYYSIKDSVDISSDTGYRDFLYIPAGGETTITIAEGKTLKCAYIGVYGTLNVSGGTIDNNIQIASTGTANLNGCTVSTGYIENEGTLYLKDSSVTGKSGGYNDNANSSIINFKDATATIDNSTAAGKVTNWGTFTAKNCSQIGEEVQNGVSICGVCEESCGTVTIDGSTAGGYITSYDTLIIQNSSTAKGVVKVKAGTATISNSAIGDTLYISGGSATVTGGTLKALDNQTTVSLKDVTVTEKTWNYGTLTDSNSEFKDFQNGDNYQASNAAATLTDGSKITGVLTLCEGSTLNAEKAAISGYIIEDGGTLNLDTASTDTATRCNWVYYVEPTCTKKGVKDHYEDKNGKKYDYVQDPDTYNYSFQQVTDEYLVIEKEPHTCEEVAATTGDAVNYGYKAHYKCTVCGALCTDAEGKNETTEEDLRTEKIPQPCGENVKWVLEENGKVTVGGEEKDAYKLIITGTGDTELFTNDSEGLPWYNYRNGITALTIDEGITGIGDSAFEGLKNLDTVSIGSSVKKIGRYAFKGAGLNNGITLPEGLTELGEYVFADTGLTQITLPAGITTVPEGTFSGCKALTGVTLLGKITDIERLAFSECDAITSMEIQDSVTSIGEYAFSGCDSLKTVTIPGAVTSLGTYMFKDCTKLEKIIFGGTGAQWQLLDVDVPLEIVEYDHYDEGFCGDPEVSGGKDVRWVLSTDQKTLTISGNGAVRDYGSANETPLSWARIENLVISEGITRIGNNAFSGDLGMQLESLTLPDSLIEIGDNAFRNSCCIISSIKLPEKLESIGTYALCGSGFTSLTIPASVKTIGKSAFNESNALKTVTFAAGSNITTIPESCFFDCQYLETVTFPENLQKIDANAFMDDYSLTLPEFPKSLADIQEGAFYGCMNLKVITYGGTITQFKAALKHNSSVPDKDLLVECSDGLLFIGVSDISDGFTVEDIPDQIYTGERITPVPEMSYRGRKLTKDKDFTISYSNNIDVGRVTMSIQGINGLTAFKLSFYIVKADYTGEKTKEVSTLFGKEIQFSIDKMLCWGGVFGKIQADEMFEDIDLTNGVLSILVKKDKTLVGQTGTITIPVTSQNYNKYSLVFTVKVTACPHTNTHIEGAKDKTCTEDGYTGDAVCDYCGDIVESGSAIKAEGHTWDDGKVTTPAGCETVGVKTYTCSVCKETKTQDIPAAGHKYSTVKENEVAPTCTKAGTYETVDKCSVCGKYNEATRKTVTGEPAKGHTWDEGKVTTPAGCETVGVKTYTCSVCKETKTEDIPALGHKYSTVKENEVAPTCTKAGTYETVDKCSVCGKYNEATRKTVTGEPAKGHTWDEGRVTTPAGCETVGVRTYTCSVCKETKTEDIPALGHKYSTVKENEVAPTCTKAGTYETVDKCSVCGKYNEATRKTVTGEPAKGHTWDEGRVTTPAGCETVGVRTYTCSVCKDTRTEDIPATGHTEVIDAAKAANCTETGLTEGKHCSVCGKILVEQQTIPAKGHTWDEGKVTTPAGCETVGVRTYTCSVCKDTRTEDIPATGHTEVIDKAKDATCTETGLTEGKHCSVCGKILVEQQMIPAKGHTWDEGKVTKEPTSTKKGIKTFTCTVCQATKTEEIPALGRPEPDKATVTKAPEAQTLTYTGAAQKLVTPGTASGGKMVYSLSETGTYSTAIPTGTDAGIYKVWYKVKGDSRHSDSDTGSVDVTIGKAANPVVVKGTVYVAAEKTVDLSANVIGAQGTVTYAITTALTGCSVNANGVFTAGKDAGTCTVTVTVAGNNNYSSKTAAITVEVKTEEAPAPKVFEVSGISNVVYTGKAVKFDDITVTYGGQALDPKKDYKVSYQNNTNAGTATVTITVKGNLEAEITKTFEILPADISGDDFTVEDITLKFTNKDQKKKPAIKWNDKALIATGYEMTYCAFDTAVDTAEPVVVTSYSTSYAVLFTGKGNFTGKRIAKVTILNDNSILLNAAMVKLNRSTFTLATEADTNGYVVPVVTVKKGKTTYVEGEDYKLTFTGNDKVGTAKVTVTGLGGTLSGSVTKTFKINGISISSANVSGLTEKIFDPSITGGITQTDYILALKDGTKLIENVDYTVSYKNNTKAGNAKIIFTGTGKYSNSKTVSFKIKKAEITEKDVVCAETAEYTKSGAKPDITVTVKGIELVPGTDYSVSYKKNNALNNSATATITGRGNYSGKIIRNFKVTQAVITDGDGSLTVTVADQFYNGKARTKLSTFLKAPVVKDTDGKSLNANTDYEKTVVYSASADGTTFIALTQTDLKTNLNDLIAAKFPAHDYAANGITIKTTITLKGNYTGTYSGTYRIASASLSSATAAVAAQAYTGEEIVFDPTSPDFDNIFSVYLTVNGVSTKLVYGVDFEIVPGSYSNNIKTGTASVMIRGIGKYAGTKKVTFKIVARTF